MFYSSPVGTLAITTKNNQLVRIDFIETKEIEKIENDFEKQIHLQLDEYFSGKRRTFSLPFSLSGTEFQKHAWAALTKIPYGETRSYAQQAGMVHKPRAARAIGNANNKNPLPIIIPCHRVIGANGSLAGYGGGVWKKVWLLSHEQKYL